jgi:hypothetical protein
MGLRATVAADLRAITEDADAGFGWPIRITAPDAEVAVEIVGLSNDISTTIDPDTGQAVTGRAASVAIALATLEAVGLDVPVGITDGASKPWRVAFDDITGEEHHFKVASSRPDRAAGIVVCLLEFYEPPPSDS